MNILDCKKKLGL